jgi:Flp pilus assembly protein TadG
MTNLKIHPSRGPLGRGRIVRGQALAEFALILPILLALVGAGIDFARAFQASITLQTATRSAAEAAATLANDQAEAESEAREIVCAASQHLPGFVAGPGGSVPQCVAPDVDVTFNRSTTAPGASVTYPIATADVSSALDFDLLIPWPLLPEGSWTLGATQSYDVIQGRQ